MRHLICIQLLLLFAFNVKGQSGTDSVSQPKYFKNTIRYNISNAILFGFDKFLVIGYERVLNHRQSFSINVGKAALPKLASIETDSLSLLGDRKNSGFNVSVDYRFYLQKQNKYHAPRGVYIGPYYSFIRFDRSNEWNIETSSGTTYTRTDMKFDIHSIGFQLGYQFVFWDRLALDLVLIGPGVGFYGIKGKVDTNLTDAQKQQLREGIQQMLTQKFPGMNYVISGEELDANGVLRTTTLGYRYLIHIGFRF